jgi:hypothetical protein
MKHCPTDCPCRFPRSRTLTGQDHIRMEYNHFDETGEPRYPQTETTPPQGEVHWLDWHESEE